jgi:hypothetical protein
VGKRKHRAEKRSTLLCCSLQPSKPGGPLALGLLDFGMEDGYTLVLMWALLKGLGIAFVIFVVLFVIVDFAKHRKE